MTDGRLAGGNAEKATGVLLAPEPQTRVGQISLSTRETQRSRKVFCFFFWDDSSFRFPLFTFFFFLVFFLPSFQKEDIQLEREKKGGGKE